MIVNDARKVRPHRYADKDFRWFMGDELGKATADDFLAAWIWAKEGVFTQAVWNNIAERAEQLEREVSEATRRQTAQLDDTPEPIARACRAAARRLLDILQPELREAEQARLECRKAWKLMSRGYGDDPVDIYEETKRSPSPSLFESIMPLWDQHQEARKRIKAALRKDRNELHRIALLDAQRIAFIRSEASVSLEQVSAMHHTEFERLAADLVQRDGYNVIRPRGGAGDLGADVIAKGPGGDIVVIQCKHTTGNATVGSPVLQRLNGTARPVHGADVVIAMTNGSFSLPARRFAESQTIHLIESEQLEQWATWGQPLPKVLDLTSKESAA